MPFIKGNNTMKKLLLILLCMPMIGFGQVDIELRADEEFLMQDNFSQALGKVFLQPGKSYLTNQRFYFTTRKKALATKHFNKSFEYDEILKIKKVIYNLKLGINSIDAYKIILKNGEKHVFTVSEIGLRRKWISKIEQLRRETS